MSLEEELWHFSLTGSLVHSTVPDIYLTLNSILGECFDALCTGMYRTLASLVQLSEWYSPATKGGLQNRHMRGFLRVLSYFLLWFCECSVQYSRSVVSDSLRPHRLQHTRFPYPSQTPGACSNFRPSSWWCYPPISSSVIPFASCLQSFPASGFFLMNQLLASDSQSIGASISDLPMNIQDWFPLGLMVWAPCSPRDSQESSPTPQFKSFHSFEHPKVLSFLYGPTLTSIHDYWKNHSFD